MQLIAQGLWHAIVVLWSAIVHAMIGWVAVGPVAIALCYLLLRRLLEHAASKRQRRLAAASVK
jgi:hypothetical protein